jgi:hypothetical protein
MIGTGTGIATKRNRTEPGQDRKGTGSKDKRTGTETWREQKHVNGTGKGSVTCRKWAVAVACLDRETDTVRHLFLAFGCDI